MDRLVGRLIGLISVNRVLYWMITVITIQGATGAPGENGYNGAKGDKVNIFVII